MSAASLASSGISFTAAYGDAQAAAQLLGPGDAIKAAGGGGEGRGRGRGRDGEGAHIKAPVAACILSLFLFLRLFVNDLVSDVGQTLWQIV